VISDIPQLQPDVLWTFTGMQKYIQTTVKPPRNEIINNERSCEAESNKQSPMTHAT